MAATDTKAPATSGTKYLDAVKLLALHPVNGLTPGEIAKDLGVSPAWVSQNLPHLEAKGFAARDPETGRWRAGVLFMQISNHAADELRRALGKITELQQRYSARPY
jgi:DNA-binding IclR family transcriptional regulator